MKIFVILLLLTHASLLVAEEVGWGFLAKGKTTGFAKWGVGKKSPEAWLRHMAWRPPNPFDPTSFNFQGPQFSGHPFVHLQQQRKRRPAVGPYVGEPGSGASDPGSALLGWPEGGPFGSFGPWFGF